MPELPEVQTVVSTIAPALTGETIERATLYRDDIVTPHGADLPRFLKGRRIREIARRAKRIIFTLDDGNRFYIHLGMSGRLTMEQRDQPRAKHTHFVMQFAKRGEELRFRDPRRFGGVWWIGKRPADIGLGPEPLTVSATQLHSRLSKTTRAIKNALLDQTVIAGLGNIYVDESLFSAGIHPLTPAHRLKPDAVKRLTQAIKQVLRRALHHRGSTLRDYVDAAGERGRFQNLHRVYDRAGDPCAKCKSAIARIVLGGRSTHFCRKCQKR